MYAAVLHFGVQYVVRHPKLLKITKVVSPFVIYLLISCLILRPPSLSALHDELFNSSPDPQQFVWFLNWWPYALTHHLNPFITRFVWYPQGYNLAWATSIPALGLIMAPVTMLGGAVLSFNLIALLAPVLSALTCFYLVYTITKRYMPALIGGYIYGFSTFEMAQIVGHPQVYVNFLVPLIILLCWRWVGDKMKTVRFVAVVGLLLALQFGISTEIYATFIVFWILAAIVFYIFSPREARAKIAALAIRFSIALLVSLVLVSPYLYYIVVGYATIPEVLHPLGEFSTDLLNYVIPTPVTQFGGQLALGVSQHFLGNYSEDGAYIGFPLLGILIFVAIRYWRKRYVLSLFVLLILIMLFALGPTLHIAGHSGHVDKAAGLPLPWIIPAHVPVIKAALPGRFTMYMFLIISMLIGIWLSSRTAARAQVIKYVVLALAILAILPASSQYTWSRISVPVIFSKQQVSRYIHKGSNVIILPYGRLGSDMYYQYVSGMRFTQAGGYVGTAPSNYTNDVVLASFLSTKPQPHFQSDLVKFCVKNRVTKIIYLPQTAPALKEAIKKLGWPTRAVHQTMVVSVPQVNTV